jgi:hypothetical protein
MRVLITLLALQSSVLAFTSTVHSAGKHWEVFRTIQELEQDGISSNHDDTAVYHESTSDVVDVLKDWSHHHVGDDDWRSLLNKANLRHEVEESIVALHHLRRWTTTQNSTTPFIAVDVCCGKGLFSMLLSYLAVKHQDLAGLSRIILLDKDPKIDWRHIQAANKRTERREGPPIRPMLELWAGTNLHDYDSSILAKLQSYNQTIALTGIHLCKTLGPAFVSLANQLGPQRAPYLCLAPCCLPRRTASLPIGQYEAPMQRSMRLQARQHRLLARERPKSRCYVCHGDHHVRECPQQHQYDNEKAWNDAVASALVTLPCWNCGKMGHRRSDCTEESAEPIEQPAIQMDLSMLQEIAPYESYCKLLSTFVQHTSEIKVVDSGLTSQHSERQGNSNWNQNRKSVFIVASR